MNHQEFIDKCNEMGAAKTAKSPRFDEMAKLCGHVAGFNEKGLSFLASLLSDQYTAAGQLNEQGKQPDRAKVWSMEFLAGFNPEGHTCIDNHAMLRNFARQLSAGKPQFEPDLGNGSQSNHGESQFPSKQIVDEILETRFKNDDKLSHELMREEIEDYYDEHEMVLPAMWETVTRNNLRKWYPSRFE